MKRAVFAAILAIAAAVVPASAELGNLKIFPNPFRVTQGNTVVNFQGMTGGATIKIYNVAGRVVFEKSIDASTTSFAWDVKNNSGENIASGMYIYFIESGGDTRKGKLGILR